MLKVTWMVSNGPGMGTQVCLTTKSMLSKNKTKQKTKSMLFNLIPRVEATVSLRGDPNMISYQIKISLNMEVL